MSALLLCLALAGALQGEAAPELDAWTASNLVAFQEAVVPLIDVSAERLEAEWVVSARSLPSFDQPVTALVVFKSHDGEVHASLTLAADPLGRQLQALHGAFPDASPSDLAPKARVERRTATSSSCAALIRIARDFEAMRISVLPQNFLTVDPMAYQFKVATYYGTTREYSALEPPGAYWGRLGDHPDPLIAWFKAAEAALAKCSHGVG